MASKILCCLCGTSIFHNDAAMCVDCLRGQFDISDCIEKNSEIVRCKKCDRWMSSRDHWQHHEMESQSLLSMCLRKIGGLSQVKIIDAKFIWTEPHSLRLKVEIEFERGVLDDKVTLRQKTVVEYIIKNKQCHDCIREATDHTWGALLQLRQRVLHKNSLCALESSMIKAGLHETMINIQMSKEGIDFFFKSKNQCDKVVDFISTQMPSFKKQSKKLISRDLHSNSSRFEHTTLLEIAPLCKGDLLISPKSLTGSAELMLVQKLSSSVHLINPTTLNEVEVSSTRYFTKPFVPLLSMRNLVTFVVLDVTPVGVTHASAVGSSSRSSSKHAGLLAEAEVCREVDFGSNDQSYQVITHLGHILQAGDIVLGYDLAHTVMDDSDFADLSYDRPDILLVRKSYPNNKLKKRSDNRRSGGGAASGRRGGGGGGSSKRRGGAASKGEGSTTGRSASVSSTLEDPDLESFEGGLAATSNISSKSSSSSSRKGSGGLALSECSSSSAAGGKDADGDAVNDAVRLMAGMLIGEVDEVDQQAYSDQVADEAALEAELIALGLKPSHTQQSAAASRLPPQPQSELSQLEPQQQSEMSPQSAPEPQQESQQESQQKLHPESIPPNPSVLTGQLPPTPP